MPKFCPMTSWNPHAETLVPLDEFKDRFFNIFVNTNNTMYVATENNGLMSVNLNQNGFTPNALSKNLLFVLSVFVVSENELYVYGVCNNCSFLRNISEENVKHMRKRDAPDEYKYCCYYLWPFRCRWYTTCPVYTYFVQYEGNKIVNRTIVNESINMITNKDEMIYQWSINATSSTVKSMAINGSCFNIFVDSNNTIYCSMTSHHQVVNKFMEKNTDIFTKIAGTGESDSTPETLRFPMGIFIESNFNLYVADSGNNRIQLFKRGNLNGTTIGTNGSFEHIELSYPTGIVLDADGFLFILDSGNHRIIGSGPNGFRCVVGCSGRNGSASNLLSNPITMNFDNYGNIIVVDRSNHRIQRFRLATNSCGKFSS